MEQDDPKPKPGELDEVDQAIVRNDPNLSWKPIIRVLSGAFWGSPLEWSKEHDNYVEAELLEHAGNGAGQHYGQHYVMRLPNRTPMWVFDAFVHPEDRGKLGPHRS
jgi:hypothetical protein